MARTIVCGVSLIETVGKLFSWLPGIGNAALRDRVALAQEAAAASRRKAAASALREINLESEVKGLRFELQQCATKAHALEKALWEKQQKEKDEDRPEPEHGLLQYINKHGEPMIEQIAANPGKTEDAALYFLTRLDKEDLVYCRGNMDGEQWWKLTQKGRDYLAVRGLLK